MKKDKIDIKIGSKLEAMWTTVVENQKKLIEDMEKELLITKTFLKTAEEQKKKEKKKFWSK